MSDEFAPPQFTAEQRREMIAQLGRVQAPIFDAEPAPPYRAKNHKPDKRRRKPPLITDAGESGRRSRFR